MCEREREGEREDGLIGVSKGSGIVAKKAVVGMQHMRLWFCAGAGGGASSNRNRNGDSRSRGGQNLATISATVSSPIC